MHNSGFVVIICWLLLQGEFSLASGNNEIDLEEFACIVEQCNEYCSLTATPCHDHFAELKVATDANNEMKDKIHTLEVTINSLRSQINDRDDQIKDLRKQIKDKDEHITDFREQVKIMSGVLSEKNYQLSKMNETAENLSDRCPNVESNSIFRIEVKGMEPFPVRCDSGWTVIQRRIDGSVNFKRNWKDYKNGFGDMWGEFFIGLDKLYLITAAHPQELYIDLRDANGTERFARYDNFTVGSEQEGFILKSLGEYWGNAGDSLRTHETGKFATLDRDSSNSCVREFDGPWWFTQDDHCGKSSLNGRYTKNGEAPNKNGISWWHWQNDYTISLTFV